MKKIFYVVLLGFLELVTPLNASQSKSCVIKTAPHVWGKTASIKSSLENAVTNFNDSDVLIMINGLLEANDHKVRKDLPEIIRSAVELFYTKKTAFLKDQSLGVKPACLRPEQFLYRTECALLKSLLFSANGIGDYDIFSFIIEKMKQGFALHKGSLAIMPVNPFEEIKTFHASVMKSLFLFWLVEKTVDLEKLAKNSVVETTDFFKQRFLVLYNDQRAQFLGKLAYAINMRCFLAYIGSNDQQRYAMLPALILYSAIGSVFPEHAYRDFTSAARRDKNYLFGEFFLIVLKAVHNKIPALHLLQQIEEWAQIHKVETKKLPASNALIGCVEVCQFLRGVPGEMLPA